ncbi:MAG: FAD-dependent thymidylate synthase [Clostridium sp.]|nr:FAD-dependent thymidylate synthase [Clostridium sp.]
MRIIKPQVILEEDINGEEILKKIEKIGRVCYKSENNVTEESSKRFVSNVLKRHHESVIEHESISVRIVCDRGVTHELVRHRVASYSQESTRYCNYSNDKFGNELTFIEPCFWQKESKQYKLWENQMKQAEDNYIELINEGATPQEARSILPNSLKTEIVVTMNLREWRHFFKLRTAPDAHPQMIEIAKMILDLFKEKIPVIFDEI